MSPTAYTAKQGLLMRHTDWWPPLLILVLLVSSWMFLVKRADDDNSRAIRDTLVINGNVAQAMANHIDQLFRRLRLFNQILVSFNTNETAMNVVRSALKEDKLFLRLMYFDASGRLLFSTSQRPEPWLQEAAKDFAEKQKTNSSEKIVFGKVPRDEEAQAWTLPVFYRPASSANGSRGFFIALIDKRLFPQSFGDVVLGKGGDIVLVANGKEVLLRMHEGLLFATGSNAGTEGIQLEAGYNVDLATDDPDQLFAYRHIPSTPLAVLVSRPRYEVLQEQLTTQRGYLGSALLLTIPMLALTFLWIIAAHRRRLLIRCLTLTQENNERLIDQIGNEKEAAYRLATHDKLTGLPNRMLFADLASRYVGRAQRMHGRFAVMFIDLDRFKPINDNYGHKAGDHLLIEVAHRLQECIRQTDVVSRFGGDEFVALVTDLHDNLDASGIAEKIVARLSEPFVGIVEDELRVTPSIGIAFYPDDAKEIDALIRQSDAAMYQAKGKGRATFAFADPDLNRRNELRNRIEAALPAALNYREFRVHYQPKVSLSDFRITGLEALARWNHPQLGAISPADFIPVAEECGAIIEFGEYIITEVCRQLEKWSHAGLSLVPVAVNISPRQLRSPRLYDFIASTLEQCGISPSFLEIEITETGLIDAGDGFTETLHRLAALGVQLAIDDFGTGYSGLSHLRNLPARYLKIDRSFIKDIRNDINDATIVSTTISLSHNLNLLTIAEGVETQEQVAHLKAARCDQAQGYFFSPPCEVSAIETLLAKKYIHVEMDNR